MDGERAQVQQGGAVGPLQRFDSLEAIFLTHLHMDHLADYYNFFVLGGNVPNADNDNLAGPVRVFGPDPAGGLPPKFRGGQAPTVAPDNPTPGTRAMTEHCHQAYAYSNNMFMLESHVEAQQVGPIARRSRAGRLVLTHIGDLGHTPLDTAQWAKWASNGYDDEVTIGEDLQRIVLA